jgi:hypothetical protein
MTTDTTDPVLDPQLQARAERAAWWQDTQARRSQAISLMAQTIGDMALDDPDRPGMITELVKVARLYLDKIGMPRDLNLTDLTVLIPPDGIGP